jgi:hypothetical protein
MEDPVYTQRLKMLKDLKKLTHDNLPSYCFSSGNCWFLASFTSIIKKWLSRRGRRDYFLTPRC